MPWGRALGVVEMEAGIVERGVEGDVAGIVVEMWSDTCGLRQGAAKREQEDKEDKMGKAGHNYR